VLLCEQKHQSLSPGFYVVHLDFLFEIRNHQYKTKTIIKREASRRLFVFAQTTLKIKNLHFSRWCTSAALVVCPRTRCSTCDFLMDFPIVRERRDCPCVRGRARAHTLSHKRGSPITRRECIDLVLSVSCARRRILSLYRIFALCTGVLRVCLCVCLCVASQRHHPPV